MSDPASIGKWFGDLDQPWMVARTGRIDFGDGDFFVVTPTEIAEPEFIEFEWSFLGVGPVNRIRWTISSQAEGSTITVEDSDPDRTPAEADQMVAGWADFFGRLRRFLVTGEPERYDWRDDIDGSVNLPEGDFVPLAKDSLYRWLPIASDGFAPRWFFVVDDDGPRRFRVENWNLESNGLTFSVEIPNASASTSCTVEVEAIAHGTRLRFAHQGWRSLGLSDGHSRALRRRFTATWIAALEQAQGMATAAAPTAGGAARGGSS
ncbi:MAG: SRPBCC family protein [Pseudonocardiaceae bacterium]